MSEKNILFTDHTRSGDHAARTYMDVTYPVNDKLLIYPGDPIYEHHRHLSIANGDLCNVGRISMGCHTGTHMDAPYHFIKDGLTIDQLDLNRFNGTARVIEFDQSGDIDVQFLEKQQIVSGERLIFKTRNTARFAGQTLLDDYTAISADGARYLADLQVGCIGIDYLTIEPASSSCGHVHQMILGAGIPVIETLNLKGVAPGIYKLCCLPLKLEGMDGSPVRALLFPCGMGPRPE